MDFSYSKTRTDFPRSSSNLSGMVCMSYVQNMEANIFRVFFIFDEGKIVVLFNVFQKKSQKTPPNEIEKALKIKEAYYADKQS